MKGGPRIGSGRRGTRQNESELRRVIPVPDAPAELSEREQAVWCRLKTQVDPLRIYTSSDLTSFTLWTRTVAMLEASLDGEATDTALDGTPKKPSLAAINVLVRTASMLGQRFRADPVSRGAVAAPAQHDGDGRDLDDFSPLPGLRMVPPKAG